MLVFFVRLAFPLASGVHWMGGGGAAIPQEVSRASTRGGGGATYPGKPTHQGLTVRLFKKT